MKDETGGPAALEAVLLANRKQMVRFLDTFGTGADAEDLFQEIWINLHTRPVTAVGRPLSYLYRVAHNLLRDRYRSARQARIRESDWHQLMQQDEMSPRSPTVERATIARQSLDHLERALATLGPRASACLRLHRLEGVSQKEVAIELGISLSTVENDLRQAYAVLLAAKKGLDLN